MAEPEDLLSKADALMARHRPARTGAEPYAEIPLLDEVVDLPPDGDDLPVLTELVLSAPPDEEEIKALAASIRASLLAALQPEIDTLIEERLKAGLPPLIERMFHEVRDELQIVTREVLGEAIRTAVQQELGRRK
jgi:hypothetical protein